MIGSIHGIGFLDPVENVVPAAQVVPGAKKETDDDEEEEKKEPTSPEPIVQVAAQA